MFNGLASACIYRERSSRYGEKDQATEFLHTLSLEYFDTCERNAIKTTYLPTSDMHADIMTKNLPRDTHWKHAHRLGLVGRDSVEVADRPRVKRLK